MLSRCPISNHQKMIFHWFGMITIIWGKLSISVRLIFQAKKTTKEMNFSFCLTWRALEGVQYVHENTKNEVYSILY